MVKLASGILAVIPKLALFEVSSFKSGMPSNFAALLSLEKVPTCTGFPSSLKTVEVEL